VPSATGLYLEVWNNVTNATELVNLSYGYTDVTAASGNLSGTGSPFVSGVTNPTGAGGTVSQLDFGDIANSSSFASNSVYTVVAGATATQTGITQVQGLEIGASSKPGVTEGGLGTVISNVQSEIANWASQTGATGTFYDSSGGTTVAGNAAPSSSLSFGNSAISGGAVGSSLSFYNILGNTSAASTKDGIPKGSDVVTAYSGFWYLNSSTGDLTYNVSASPVPLPAAVWLFGSGLLGLAGVGRRRATV
jgi:hypothetical protein